MDSKKHLPIVCLVMLALTAMACSLPAEEQAQTPTDTPAAAEQPAEGQAPPAEEQPPAGEQPPGGAPDLAAAAEILGITEQELQAALGPPPPDLAAAAQTLGITEEELRAALDAAGAAPPDNGPPAEEPPSDTASAGPGNYAIVDTGQEYCYADSASIPCPAAGAAFFGQDAQYAGLQPSYVDNGDGTIADLNTGLMWQQNPGAKMTLDEALAGAESFNLAGYDDWRMPTIKELYSLIDFSGKDVSGWNTTDTSGLMPFIDTDYFDFVYGDTNAGERIIDSQYASSTRYVSTTMNGDETVFGVNFADGRIKGYGLTIRGASKTFFVMYVRGNPDYGVNDFVDNGDGTVTDQASGLMWMQADSGVALSWEQALNYCESADDAGYTDWRLPDAKEQQSILDYTRSPDTTGSAAIDPIFSVSSMSDEGGNPNYPFYWTSTTHTNMQNGANAVYIAFGEALGWMQDPTGSYALLDVHGAGAQRSDPKTGDASEYPYGHGPQGDVIRIHNYARCVRGGAEFVEVTGVDTSESVGQPASGSQPPAGEQPPAGGQPGGAQAPDLAAAAQQLGVTEAELQAALGPPPPDLAAAAATLGVSEQELRDALGVP